MPATVTKKVEESGYPVWYIEFNGEPAYFHFFQKERWFRDHGAVFLGPEWQSRVSVTVPENRANGQSMLVLDGFTDDPAVQELYRQYLKETGG